jgi:NAD(P)-dependent dehydrogenase (short-subunit alcohol dehydrogenase family)
MPKRARNAATAESSSGLAQQLAGRVILITGAGGGIGRAAAICFAERGANVVAADVNTSAVAETVKMVQALPVHGEAEAVTVDVQDEASVDAMVQRAVRRFGRLDGALNAAGIEGTRAPVHETSAANFDRVLGVNLRGVFLCMRSETAQMLKQQPPPRRAGDEGPSKAPIDGLNYSIVNMSSTAGLGGMPEFAVLIMMVGSNPRALPRRIVTPCVVPSTLPTELHPNHCVQCYSASKWAILGLTKSAAREYASAGIRVNAICPSTTATPMVERFTEQWPEWKAKLNASFPVGRIGRADEVAAAAAFLFSAECPMMTGTSLTIDGGLSA